MKKLTVTLLTDAGFRETLTLTPEETIKELTGMLSGVKEGDEFEVRIETHPKRRMRGSLDTVLVEARPEKKGEPSELFAYEVKQVRAISQWADSKDAFDWIRGGVL